MFSQFSQSVRVFGRGFAAAAAFVVVAPAAVRAEEAGSFTCPVLGSKIESVTKDTLSADYRGVRYYFCCASCKPQFEKDPAKFLKSTTNKDKVIGASLFDPISTKRLDPDKAAAHRDYNGVRYFFSTADEKRSFDKEPKKLALTPEKDVLFCPVSNETVDSYAEASDYSDVKGTRYYFCCAGCKPKFDQNPDKYLEGLDARIKAAKKKSDK